MLSMDYQDPEDPNLEQLVRSLWSPDDGRRSLHSHWLSRLLPESPTARLLSRVGCSALELSVAQHPALSRLTVGPVSASHCADVAELQLRRLGAVSALSMVAEEEVESPEGIRQAVAEEMERSCGKAWRSKEQIYEKFSRWWIKEELMWPSFPHPCKDAVRIAVIQSVLEFGLEKEQRSGNIDGFSWATLRAILDQLGGEFSDVAEAILPFRARSMFREFLAFRDFGPMALTFIEEQLCRNKLISHKGFLVFSELRQTPAFWPLALIQGKFLSSIIFNITFGKCKVNPTVSALVNLFFAPIDCLEKGDSPARILMIILEFQNPVNRSKFFEIVDEELKNSCWKSSLLIRCIPVLQSKEIAEQILQKLSSPQDTDRNISLIHAIAEVTEDFIDFAKISSKANDESKISSSRLVLALENLLHCLNILVTWSSVDTQECSNIFAGALDWEFDSGKDRLHCIRIIRSAQNLIIAQET